MATNHTEHYELSQWVRTDRVEMDDFNGDNRKIDAALHELAGEMAKKGNLRVTTGSYNGNGQSGSFRTNSLTFETRPLFVLVLGPETDIFPGAADSGSSIRNCTFHWSENTVSWSGSSASGQLNTQGAKYTWLAFYAD